MITFYVLVFLAACLLWLLLSSMYKPLGKLGHRLWKDAKDAMTDENNINKESMNEKE